MIHSSKIYWFFDKAYTSYFNFSSSFCIGFYSIFFTWTSTILSNPPANSSYGKFINTLPLTYNYYLKLVSLNFNFSICLVSTYKVYVVSSVCSSSLCYMISDFPIDTKNFANPDGLANLKSYFGKDLLWVI